MSEHIELTESREANAFLRQRLAAVQDGIVRHITDALTSSSSVDTIHMVRQLATVLDGVGLNIDTALDEHLAEQGLDYKYLTTPVSVNRQTRTWSDYARRSWDLTKIWVDRDGDAWKWTGDILNGEPFMRHVDRPTSTAMFDTLVVLSGPLTAREVAS